MKPPAEIKYLLHDKLDKKKWDACIQAADQGHIYAESFYLDTMAMSWDGLVMNDYEAVMPLPKRKKWGVQYLFQPFLTPLLGVFGKSVNEKMVSAFLEAIPSSFRLWDINLHPGNPVDARFQKQFPRRNYILSLEDSYQAISSGYSDNISRNINKAEKLGCRVLKDIPTEAIIAICSKEYPSFAKVEDGNFERVKRLMDHYRATAKNYGVYGPGNQLLASCGFLFYRQRAYYWLVGNTEAVREYGASHMLIDSFIRDHAGSELLLDFEGSDEPGIAEFYQRFGAKLENYTTIYHSRLPFPLNWIKRIPAYYKKIQQKGD